MRILVSEDNRFTALVLQRALEEFGHGVTLTKNGEEALQSLAEGHFRIIISDWMMPGMDGLELCRRVRQSEDCAYVYIILITAKNNREDRLEALRTGADDFLTKPVDRDELAARLQVAERILEMQDMFQRHSVELEEVHLELARANARLAELATIDSLTGLKNHGHFRDSLQTSVAHAGRTSAPLSLIMLDVDHFKQFNDTFGHPAGDEVLRQVAEILQNNVREYDVAARYGGEEFAVLLSGADAEHAMTLAERILEAVCQKDWPEAPVTVSIGIATHGLETQGAVDLLEKADRSLYFAKKKGRNRVIHATGLSADQLASVRSAA